MMNAKNLSACIAKIVSMILFSLTPAQAADTHRVPEWVSNHPVSRTHFIGVGSARVGHDLLAAQKLARSRALQDIAEQIRVTFTSDATVYARTVALNSAASAVCDLEEKIRAVSQVQVAGWNEARTYYSPDGFYWSKVIIRKTDYYNEANARSNSTKQRIRDILAHAERGNALFRILEMHKALKFSESLSGVLPDGKLDKESIILINEIRRRIAQFLGSITIAASEETISLGAAQRAPTTLGMYVYVNGVADTSLPLTMSATSDKAMIHAGRPGSDGFRRVTILSLPPSGSWTTVFAMPDLQAATYELIRRKFTLPRGTFAIRREAAEVYLGTGDTFTAKLARALAERTAIRIVSEPRAAAFILRSGLEIRPGFILRDNVFQAEAKLSVRLESTGLRRGEPASFSGTLRTGDAISGQRALDTIESIAVETAVDKVERFF